MSGSTVIALNGPLNAGKSHVGHALMKTLPDAHFIEGDDHGAPADSPLEVRIGAAMTRLETHVLGMRCRWLIIAFPLRDEDMARLRRAAEWRSADLYCVTLAPPLAVTRTNRGERELTRREQQRLVQMYEEGFDRREFSDLILDNSHESVTGTVDRILAWLKTRE
ncbi:hypothetical protein [Kushneria phosphatilytica]|uniref:Shikimate kinase n=1 Tax=Kushneria phosphatilytica TaxID=657387 RepID=A0A1S1NUL7_9GAMM|nr:hypothetical protein [Kushneria phosphatilytica]OHV07126.1 hypothetical protein BH688_16870 [Kushneria phosphatilytica]QEL10338.1 shikimate kinase [Kushneria phosphatilytica]